MTPSVIRSPCTERPTTPLQIRCASFEGSSAKALMLASLPVPVGSPVVQQAVADAPDVQHEQAVAWRGELATQPRGVRVERACPAKRSEAPDVSEQLLLREHTFRIRHELEQKLVLLARQRNRDAADGDTSGRAVGGDW